MSAGSEHLQFAPEANGVRPDAQATSNPPFGMLPRFIQNPRWMPDPVLQGRPQFLHPDGYYAQMPPDAQVVFRPQFNMIPGVVQDSQWMPDPAPQLQQHFLPADDYDSMHAPNFEIGSERQSNPDPLLDVREEMQEPLEQTQLLLPHGMVPFHGFNFGIPGLEVDITGGAFPNFDGSLIPNFPAAQTSGHPAEAYLQPFAGYEMIATPLGFPVSRGMGYPAEPEAPQPISPVPNVVSAELVAAVEDKKSRISRILGQRTNINSTAPSTASEIKAISEAEKNKKLEVAKLNKQQVAIIREELDWLTQVDWLDLPDFDLSVQDWLEEFVESPLPECEDDEFPSLDPLLSNLVPLNLLQDAAVRHNVRRIRIQNEIEQLKGGVVVSDDTRIYIPVDKDWFITNEWTKEMVAYFLLRSMRELPELKKKLNSLKNGLPKGKKRKTSSGSRRPGHDDHDDENNDNQQRPAKKACRRPAAPRPRAKPAATKGTRSRKAKV
ncbi:hypothetical protein K490DRAFT_67283 [Saccharata proteae CBS 121410]|uniref:Uncharacterized protein n=1 Tax=Saccharata proteae CBS 121410 TaxID=1314787 RepID=A0A9P4LVI8_9PEZI|nr:hypothetical protein K490DRAFT_67283 [Saccharata proteae CBS 121410]